MVTQACYIVAEQAKSLALCLRLTTGNHRDAATKRTSAAYRRLTTHFGQTMQPKRCALRCRA